MQLKNRGNVYEKAEKTKSISLAQMPLSLLLIGMGIVVLIAFVSYFFTWKFDQNIQFTSSIGGEKNWAGNLGAIIANELIKNRFGVASFFIPLVLIVLGFRVLKVNLLPLVWTIKTSATGMVLLPIILGFVFYNTYLGSEYLGSGLGGAHGRFMAEWLESLLGPFGTPIILILLAFLFLILSFRWYAQTTPLVFKKKAEPNIPKKEIENTIENQKNVMYQEFYYLDDNVQKGPLSIDQLKSVGLKPDTWVWTAGLDNWKPAKEVEELKFLVSLPPPPIPIMNTKMEKSDEQNGDQKQTIIVNQVEHQSNGVGIAGFVFALIAVFIGWLPILGWILWFLGFILSFAGLFNEPKGLAIAGFIISLVGLLLILFLFATIAAMFGAFL